jgi:protein involved in polysaccharide export with SLBB domain
MMIYWGKIEVAGPDRIALPFIGQLAGVNHTIGNDEKAMMTNLEFDRLMTPQVTVTIVNCQLSRINGEVRYPEECSNVRSTWGSTRFQ